MGSGYWILLWDGFGSGLVMINPRLLTDGRDIYQNPNNWFSCNENTKDEEIVDLHQLHDSPYYKIIRN